MNSIDSFKKEISELGVRLYNKGFAPGTSGNISFNLGNKFLITPSGSNLGEVKQEDIVITDMNGQCLEEGKKPSSEKAMHIEIYRARPDINSIIHVHPPKSTAFAVAGRSFVNPALAEAAIVLGPVPVAEYATPSSNKLALIVANYFKNHDVVLMANHGVVVGGRGLKETYYKIEALESYAEIMLWAKLLGNVNELSSENIQELNKIREKLIEQHK